MDASRRRFVAIAACALLLPWIANVLLFAPRVANPLIYSDNWTFIETFLRGAIEDGFGLGDLMVKRAGLDHAQPLNKWLMWLDYRWFGLDFGHEAMVGVGCAITSSLLLAAIAVRDPASTFASRRPYASLPVAAATGAVLVSLNGAFIYAYPMVAMQHAFYLCAFATMALAWRASNQGSLVAFAAMVVVCGIVGDDSAILLGLALAASLALLGWRRNAFGRVMQVMLVLVLGLAACRLLYATLGEVRGTTQAVFNVPLTTRIAMLAAQWRDGWALVEVPLSAGVASRSALVAWFPAHWETVRAGIAVVVGIGHAWFWRRAMHARIGIAWFVALCTMLLFYANMCGLMLGRVFVRGPGFLDQTRYIFFYQLGIVALLLMGLTRMPLEPGRGTRAAIASFAVAILLLQIPLSVVAWSGVPHQRAAYVRMARSMGAMARAPQSPPADCESGVNACLLPQEQAARTMAMLVDHRVNLFSPRFRRNHPDLAKAAGPVPAHVPMAE